MSKATKFVRSAAVLSALWPALAGAAVLAATPIGRMDLPAWRARFEAKQQLIATGRYDLIYYGDSITQNFERVGPTDQGDWRRVWDRYYGNRHALNLGFKGDTTASLLWRIEHGEGAVRGLHGDPRVAIVLIGANNLGRLHWSAADTVAGIVADIAAIHAHLPRTRVVLVSVLPSDRSAWISRTTDRIDNTLAEKFARNATPWVSYVDARAALMQNGRTDDSLFIDRALTPPDPPLHPNARGQTLVAELIEPVLAGALADAGRPGALPLDPAEVRGPQTTLPSGSGSR